MKTSKLLLFFVIGIFTVLFVGCGHTHSYSKTVVSPTVNEIGYTKYSCKCGEFYTEDPTCLLTFLSMSEYNVQVLPQIDSIIVPLNSKFLGVENTSNFNRVLPTIIIITSNYKC